MATKTFNIEDYIKASDEARAKRQEKKELYGNEDEKERFIQVLKTDFEKRKSAKNK